MRTLEEKARTWLTTESFASASADRLAAIDNPAVNRAARDAQVAKLRERAEVAEFLLALLDEREAREGRA